MTTLRAWLWVGTVLNAIIFLPAAFMAYSAVGFAVTYPDSSAPYAVAFLFLALPVFCVLAPYAAWRLHGKHGGDRNAGVMMAAPLIYGAFLTAFLLAN